MSSITDDRAAGAMLGLACGDAIVAARASVRAPGAWTAGVATAVPVLRAAAAGEPLTHESTQDAIVAAWVSEAGSAEDAPALDGLREPTASAARTAARALREHADRTALMRAVPVALPSVPTASTAGLVRAATQLAALTHADPVGGEACVLWAAAIHHAIRAGELDLRGRLALLPEDRRAVWSDLLDDAEAGLPSDFAAADGIVPALQGAWSAIADTPVPEEDPAAHLRLAIEAAVGSAPGSAAIAGALLGARWGASAVPAEWRRALHGPPGLSGSDLVRAAVLAANGGLGDGSGWPAVDRVRPSGGRVLVPHPHDDGVLLGSLAALDGLPADVDAVVSLCRVGRRQTDREQVEFWLIDRPGRNPNLDLVLRDAADTVAALRVEGRRVLVHCAEGRSRTPSVAALYSAMHLGVPAARALREVAAALPDGDPAPFLQEAVLRIGEASTVDAAVKPVLHVDLDTAVLDVASGIDRLPAAARAEYEGRFDEAPGIIARMDALPGAVAGFGRLAEVYDAVLVTAAPWGSAAAWQQRLDWVRLHFGAEERGPTGARNPAFGRLVFGRAALPRGAVLVSGSDGEHGDGERIRLGEAPFATWDDVLAHLLAPERTGVRLPGARGRSRDRVAGRPSLTAWLLESLRARGGSADVVQVTRDIWQQHEDELRRSGDLFYTWQHDLRRVAARLRDEGRLAPSSERDQGTWRLAR